jgi:hypothetical protein
MIWEAAAGFKVRAAYHAIAEKFSVIPLALICRVRIQPGRRSVQCGAGQVNRATDINDGTATISSLILNMLKMNVMGLHLGSGRKIWAETRLKMRCERFEQEAFARRI